MRNSGKLSLISSLTVFSGFSLPPKDAILIRDGFSYGGKLNIDVDAYLSKGWSIGEVLKENSI